MILELTKENFEAEITNSKKPVVIKAYASWCGPCQQMEPIFKKVAEDLAKKYKFLSLNVDDQRDIAIKYGVTSIPTMIFIKNNDVVGKKMGYIPEDQLLEKIKEYLG